MANSLDELKYEHFKSSTQIIVSDEKGVVQSSCNTLSKIDKGYELFAANSFLDIPGLKKDIKSKERIVLGDISLDFLGHNSIFSVYISRKKIEGKRQIVTVIEDRREMLSSASDEVLEAFISKIKTPLKVLRELAEVSLETRTRMNDQTEPEISLINAYIDRFSQQLKERDHVYKEEIPFKVDHISKAVSLCFEHMANHKGVSLETESDFDSKFLIGDRLKVLHGILHATSHLLDNQEQGKITVGFGYQPEEEEIKVTFRGNVMPEVYKRLYMDLKLVGEYASMGDEDLLTLTYKGKAVAYEPKLKEPRNKISKNEFPYLFSITGDDESLVMDILRTILDSMQTELENLKKSYEERDWNLVARITHKMKPNFQNIEQKALSQMLQDMEGLAINNDEKNFDSTFKEFEERATSALNRLNQYEI
ncbi:ATP-binding protein [Marinoscillum furvescens]|uniref:HPt domain-containing protein n=1 Tax=Marinoscillum furvescens DSM 4134 TaxID=1122208 RepID=A0A3D9L105_MARFU|nr:HAMP domain-containing histidine kinase [Marinoscillum furvescens]RED97423.1 hypothetical protein C7460_11232 [Marinoscillum furvescens DSM 4134]